MRRGMLGNSSGESYFQNALNSIWMLKFVITACFIGSFSSFTVSGDYSEPVDFYVTAPSDSLASDRFIYSPSSGKLYMQGEKEQFEVKSFGAIKGLNSSQIGILSFDDQHGTFLVHHGAWFTILRPFEDKPVAANIGPALPETALSTLQTYVTANGPNGKEGYFVFSGEVSQDQMVIFVVRTSGEVMWFPIRPDLIAGSLNVQLFQGSLHFSTKIDAQPLEASINLTNGTITHGPGQSLISEAKIIRKETSRYSILFGLQGAPRFPKKELFLDSATYDELENTASPFNGFAKQYVVERIRDRIRYAKAMGDRTRQALSYLKGQKEAVEEIVEVVQSMHNSHKFQVLVFGGITGSGKTSAAEALGVVLNENPLGLLIP